jgi:hypothetical protein
MARCFNILKPYEGMTKIELNVYRVDIEEKGHNHGNAE